LRRRPHDPVARHMALDDGTFRVWRWTGATPALIFLHGFGGTGRDLEAVIDALEAEREVIAPDLMGHGASPCPPPHHFSMARCAHQVLGIMDGLEGPPPALVGYSMGARVALHLAIQAPERLAALVLVGGHPGIEEAVEREARSQWDQEMAGAARTLGQPAFARHWETLPIIASQQRTPEPWGERLRTRRGQANVEGLARAIEGMGTGAMTPVWGQLDRISVPTLIVAGAEDDRYVQVSADMAQRIPRSERWLVPGCGHAPHLEAPQTFATPLEGFLARHAPLSDDVQGAP
jgi:2-succinyl-6-hydroxy-2,4-cyclohexadiene-1-carboxylate synthase